MKLSKLHFAEAPKIITPPPGPKSREYVKKQMELESSAVIYPRSVPLAFEEGKGATMKDVDGNRYLDFSSGIYSPDSAWEIH